MCHMANSAQDRLTESGEDAVVEARLVRRQLVDAVVDEAGGVTRRSDTQPSVAVHEDDTHGEVGAGDLSEDERRQETGVVV